MNEINYIKGDILQDSDTKRVICHIVNNTRGDLKIIVNKDFKETTVEEFLNLRNEEEKEIEERIEEEKLKRLEVLEELARLSQELNLGY